MNKWMKSLIAALILPVVVFFWSGNGVSLPASPDTAVVSAPTTTEENPVLSFLKGADPNEIAEIDRTNAKVELILMVTEFMYNKQFNWSGKYVNYPEGARWFVVGGESAKVLSNECNCYGLTSENVSVVFVRPDVDAWQILSHESTHLLQYSQYGGRMITIDKIVIEYQAEFLSTRVIQLLNAYAK